MTHWSNKPNPGSSTQSKHWANPHLANKTHLNFKRVKSASSNEHWLECSKPHQIKLWVYSSPFSRHFPYAAREKQDTGVKTRCLFKALNYTRLCNSCLELLPPPCLQKHQPGQKWELHPKDPQSLSDKGTPGPALHTAAAHGRWFRVSSPLMYCYIISCSVFGLLFGRN